MYNIERREEILNLLAEKRSISVAKLAKLLYVSQPTIRRDLSILEQEKKVLRTHGGVVLRNTPDGEIPLALREGQSNASKQIIAKKAAEYIHNGDVIFLDASSTASYLVPHLKQFNDIVVITNSPKTSVKLGENRIKNYCTGGLLLAHSIAYVGSSAEEFISKINANTAFFSSRGYIEGGYITDSSVEEASVKAAMLKNADKSFYLCDSSKRNKKYMYNICKLSDATLIDDATEE